MKALIRGSEVYKESDWSEFTRNHLDWMTGNETQTIEHEDGTVETVKIPGDGWTLVEDYHEDDED